MVCSSSSFNSRKKGRKALEENRLAQGMIDLIDHVVLPTENVSEVKGGQQRIVEKRYGRISFSKDDFE